MKSLRIGYLHSFKDKEMTPKEKLKQLDERLDEVHKLVIYLNECRRELINRHNLNKDKS